MRKLGVFLVGVTLAAFGAASGCSSGSKTTTGGSGGTGGNTGGGGNNAGGGGNSAGGGGNNAGGGGNNAGGGGGMALDCTGSSLPADCDACGQDQCCAELSACLADPDCSTCLDTNDPNACMAAGTIASDVSDCLNSLCQAECAPQAKCARYCCNDADCGGAAGSCSITGQYPNNVGICLDQGVTICMGIPADITMAPSMGSCAMGATCNPITNAPCTAGQACDLGQNGFQCFDPPNDTACGGTCSNSAGPFCVPGYTCGGG